MIRRKPGRKQRREFGPVGGKPQHAQFVHGVDHLIAAPDNPDLGFTVRRKGQLFIHAFAARFFSDQRPTRVINNILFCLNNGTRLGWLVDPEENVIVFQPNQQPIGQEAATDRVIMLPVLENWPLTVEEFFN